MSAEVHVEEVVLVAVARFDRVVLLERVGQRVVVLLRLIRHHVVRLDVHREPAFGGAIRDPGFLQRIGRARPLEDHEARDISSCPWRSCGFATCAPDVFAVEVVHLQDGEVDAVLLAGLLRELAASRAPCAVP